MRTPGGGGPVEPGAAEPAASGDQEGRDDADARAFSARRPGRALIAGQHIVDACVASFLAKSGAGLHDRAKIGPIIFGIPRPIRRLTASATLPQYRTRHSAACRSGGEGRDRRHESAKYAYLRHSGADVATGDALAAAPPLPTAGGYSAETPLNPAADDDAAPRRQAWPVSHFDLNVLAFVESLAQSARQYPGHNSNLTQMNQRGLRTALPTRAVAARSRREW